MILEGIKKTLGNYRFGRPLLVPEHEPHIEP